MAEEKAFVNTTPEGAKKDTSLPLPDSYHRAYTEAAWDSWWDNQGFYSASADDIKDGKDAFVMVIPPPNVTGSLHLGHALMCSVEDTLTRWHRMKGRVALWVPGTDHAGIATQAVVEKMLWKQEKKTRHDLTREDFVAKVWKWKEEYGGKICKQIRRLGCSVDWKREAFTMDENLSLAVQEAFIRMFKSGKIYRSDRLVNWSCALQTALSNVEVEPEELKVPTNIDVPGHDRKVEFGVIHSFAYKLKDSEDEIVVATTRIETMLGDVAVAIHPEDERYKKFHGKKLVHPFHPDRELDIVLDPILVDMTFGTGAVKITPAHDPNDFECGRRHGLKFINILTFDGKINENGGKFAGMPRYVARWHILQELEKLKLYRGKSPNPMVLGRCQRSGDIVEPLLMPQWYVDCKAMAKRATDATRSGELEIIPKSQERQWYGWLDKIQDWCISRQLWWGHRIPAYRVLINGVRSSNDSDMEYWVVARSHEEALKEAKERFSSKAAASAISVEQDEDVLDTWFSSGLFPFSVFGWPNETKDLKAFYPTTLLETGYDILFFWVARMVMMGLELTDKLPFKQIFLHPIVRDKYGRKMSKSLGNVVDPLDVIEGISLEGLMASLEKGNLPEKEKEKAKAGQKKDYPKGIPECGADALRFTLLDYMVQGGDINLDVDRIYGYRQFCNKLWNATKFCLTNLGKDFVPQREPLDYSKGSFADKWILGRLSYATRVSNASFEKFEFNQMTSALYTFWMKEFCAVYMEAIKPVMSGADSAEKALSQNVLYLCLDWGLKLLHPTMPFVTEELWQRLPDRKPEDSIMVTRYPEAVESWINDKINSEMAIVLDVLHTINSTREGLDVLKSARPRLFIEAVGADAAQVCKAGADILTALGKLSSAELLAPGASVGKGCVHAVVNSTITIHLEVGDSINFKGQIDKLRKKIANVDKWIAGKEKATSAQGYKEKTPAELQAKHAEELAEKLVEKDKLLKSIEQLEELSKASS